MKYCYPQYFRVEINDNYKEKNMSLLSWLKEFFDVSATDTKEKDDPTDRVRARDEQGRFVGDDPDTPENEAYTRDTRD
jgi:hypothetical protein